MSFVDPGNFVALQVVDEDDLNTIAANQRYFNDRVTPAGVVTAFAGTSAPDQWLLCDGSAVSRTTYAALFAVTGTAYGAGNGLSTFNLPDLRQRFPLGKAASGTGATLGGAGGALNAAVVSHNHTQNAHGHTLGGDSGDRVGKSLGGAVNALVGNGEVFATQDVTFAEIDTTTATNQATGVSGVDANLPPFQVLNYIIKT